MKSKWIIATLLGAVISTSVLASGPGGCYRFSRTNTPGWTLMSAEERSEFQKKMLAAKTYDECKAIQAEHHKAMEVRAKEKGVVLNSPRYNACDRMKARGMLK